MTEFDAAAAYGHTARLAKPRLTGTVGETEARQYITDRLKTLGNEVRETPFFFYPGFNFHFLKASIFAILFLLLVQHLLFRPFPTFAALISPLIWLVAWYLLGRWRYYARNKDVDHSVRFSAWRKHNPVIEYKMRSVNIETSVSKPEDPKAIVYLTAHYDSKSQNISIVFRILCAALVYLGLVLIPLLYLIGLVFPALWAEQSFMFFSFLLFIITMTAGLSLSLMSIENKSPGALDNAASCGMLLELARVYRSGKNSAPFKNLDVRMVFTGAEEMGLAGAEELVRRNLHSWEGREVFVLNFDGIGAGENHTLTSETTLFSKHRRLTEPLIRIVTNSGRKLGLSVTHLKGILGGEADHVPFVDSGIKAVSIGTYSRYSWGVHTRHDTLDKVQLPSLKTSAQLAMQILKNLDETASALESDR